MTEKIRTFQAPSMPEALAAVKKRYAILILSDRLVDFDHPPIPSLLALRTVVNALNREGLRLSTSIIVDSGEIRRPHHAARLLRFGPTALRPHLALPPRRRLVPPPTLGVSGQIRIWPVPNPFLHGAGELGYAKVARRAARFDSPVSLGRSILSPLQGPLGCLIGFVIHVAIIPSLVQASPIS